MVIIVTVIAILVMIAVPKLNRAIRSANEGATRGKMGSIRTALQIYYADTEGHYPSDLTPLMQPGSKYLTGVIPFYTAEHGNSWAINYASSYDAAADSGSWGYVNSGEEWGRIWVQCTHTDLKGKVWASY